MGGNSRTFYPNVLNHCYQRSADGGVLFYNQIDYLVLFTIVCKVARRYRVQILAMCPMPDHIHYSITAVSKRDLTLFMRDCSSLYAKEFNRVCHRTGPVFEAPFGSAPKYTDKKVRTNLIYVWNNPPERKLVTKAEDYRWNFLAYASSDHPFSEKLVIRKSRWPLQKAVKEVKAAFKAGRHLPYAMLKRLYAPLTNDEKQQITDFIISTYNVIDHEAAMSYFGNYETTLTAVHSTTGNEYDIKEEIYTSKSDKHYASMTNIVMRELAPPDIHDILSLPKEKKYEVFQLLRRYSYALSDQIAKFLHLPLNRNN